MKFPILFLSLILLFGCSEKNDIYFTEVNKTIDYNSYIIDVDYFDSLKTNISQITYRKDNEEFYFFFYESHKVKLFFKHIYLESEEDFLNISLNLYNSISFYDGSFVVYTNALYDSFYKSGNKKTVLFHLENRNEFKYLEYFENGNLKSEKKFKHKKYGDFFVPFGIWIEFDEFGKTLKEYDAPTIQQYNIDNKPLSYPEIVYGD